MHAPVLYPGESYEEGDLMFKILMTLTMTFGISLVAHGIPTSCNSKISFSEIMQNANEIVFRIKAPVLVHNAQQKTELKTFADFQFRLKKIEYNLVELSWDDVWGRSAITVQANQTPKFRKVFYLQKWLLAYPNQPGTAFLELIFEGNNFSIFDYQRDMPKNYGETTFSKLIRPTASCVTVSNTIVVN